MAGPLANPDILNLCLTSALPPPPPRRKLLSDTPGFPSFGLPCGSDSKETACSAGDLGLIPGPWRSLGEGNGCPLQYFCLVNHIDREAWQSIVHGVTKSWTGLSDSRIHPPRFSEDNLLFLINTHCKPSVEWRGVLMMEQGPFSLPCWILHTQVQGTPREAWMAPSRPQTSLMWLCFRSDPRPPFAQLPPSHESPTTYQEGQLLSLETPASSFPALQDVFYDRTLHSGPHPHCHVCHL